MLIYIVIGVFYMGLMEWYLSSGTDTSIPPMRWLDRLFHILLWPISIAFAGIEFIKYFKKK
jgi:hypothetical protein